MSFLPLPCGYIQGHQAQAPPPTALSHIPPDCTMPGKALRQLAGSELYTYRYLFPDKFNSGPVNLDRTINTHKAGLRLSDSFRFGKQILQLGAYLSKFPLSPSLLFIPLPAFSDLYLPKKGQRFALLVCSRSTLAWLI